VVSKEDWEENKRKYIQRFRKLANSTEVKAKKIIDAINRAVILNKMEELIQQFLVDHI